MRTAERRRRSRSNGRTGCVCRALLAIVGLVVSPAAIATADTAADGSVAAARAEDPLDERSSWEPGLSIGFGLHSQDLDGTFDSSLTVSTGDPLVLGRGGTNGLFGQHLSPALSLDAPAFYDDGLRPRLFVHAGGQLPLSDEHIARRYLQSFATLGNPDVLTNCAGPNPALCVVRAKNKLILNGGWYAGIGVDIRLPVTILERQIYHLRTSLDYYGQSWVGRTVIDRFSIVNPPGAPGTVQNDIIKSRSDDQVVHGLGPRIQLVLQLANWGAFRMDAFLGAQFYWLVSDNDVDYNGVNASGDTSTATTQAKPFIAQGGGGIRVVWTGWKGT